jgi:pimeloyl-ACP methyl ester carboxylesterase
VRSSSARFAQRFVDEAARHYQRLDTTKVGAMGHSQGGNAITAAASDARIQAVILLNAGTSASKPIDQRIPYSSFNNATSSTAPGPV